MREDRKGAKNDSDDDELTEQELAMRIQKDQRWTYHIVLQQGTDGGGEEATRVHQTEEVGGGRDRLLPQLNRRVHLVVGRSERVERIGDDVGGEGHVRLVQEGSRKGTPRYHLHVLLRLGKNRVEPR